MAYPLAASLSPIIQREMEGHMWRPITIGVVVTSLVALMFWRIGMIEKNVAVAGVRANPEYAIPPGSYLPVSQPSW
jgi:hypothetical protein